MGVNSCICLQEKERKEQNDKYSEKGNNEQLNFPIDENKQTFHTNKTTETNKKEF